MTFSQWYGDYLALFAKQLDSQRRGQLFANFLCEKRHDLCAPLIDAGLDPFYNDLMLPGAVDFVMNNW